MTRPRNGPYVDGTGAVYPGRALVAFSGVTELSWLRILKPGYRHCFVLIELDPAWGAGWLLYNPLSVGTQVALWPDVEAGPLRDWLHHAGYRVVQTRVVPDRAHVFAWRPFTCVEAVKRVLGLRAPGVWTPWQLYRYLRFAKTKGVGNKSLTKGCR